MQFHELKKDTPNKKSKLIGRGGTRGKTSGRGHKGQKAHGGHGIRQHMKDIIKKFPKLRGRGKNSNKSIYADNIAVNLDALETAFAAGETVSMVTLMEKGVVKNPRAMSVKVLGEGNLTKALSFQGVTISAPALEKIQKAGGSVA